ncbi:beta-ketoacyl synthase N-terminal-like domain-containing protein [Micromonospora sp. FIMYZ51]|uniref:beta-ketoacyl synthase N-terminal-like domain-containing protein n=1 Tax=Micromonospora sp. FIMYZ51 TaxID=3051832 RepID=UPI00311F6534
MSRIVAWSLHLPGDRPATGLADGRTLAVGGATPPERARDLLGRKGLLYKEPATLLALCAVHRALGLPAGHRPAVEVDPGVAVVACGNLGNVATVAEVTRTVAAEGGRAVSPLAAPNASSNVVASTVALWFGFGGPNLMICTGATAGLDGLAMAALLLRGRRARRVVVVGAEPADEVASAIHAAGEYGHPLRAGAACVILEPDQPDQPDQSDQPDRPDRPDRPDLAVPSDLTRDRRGVRLDVLATGADWPRTPELIIGPDGWDPAAHWGDGHGGQGVVSVALAAELLAGAESTRPDGIGVGCGPVGGPVRRALVRPASDGGGRG